MQRVAYLGIRGAFSEQAARKYFDQDMQDISAGSFADIFNAVDQAEAEYGILPIENSLTGSVAGSYELLTRYDNLRVSGEIILKIEHALLALPGVRIEDIKSVRSHPQALSQCNNFLSKYEFERVSWYNTAGSAKDLVAEGAQDVAAIASAINGEIYGLAILADQIQDNDANFTRFLVISQSEGQKGDHNKTSIIFKTEHKPGSLARSLNILADNGLNLTRIESRPVRDVPWEYIFYIDFEGFKDDGNVQTALSSLQASTAELRVLGSYPAAR